MLVNMKQSKTRQAKQNTTVSNIQLMGCVYLYPFSHPIKFCFVCVCGVFFFFFLAVLGLHCCVCFSLFVTSVGYSLVAIHGLLLLPRMGSSACGLQQLQLPGSRAQAQ